jgi:hypothetical protein
MTWLLVKRDLYWRPNSQGYTGIRTEAGRYTAAEVEARVNDDTTAILLSEAPEFSKGCDLLFRAEYLLKQRDSLIDALVKTVRIADEARDEWDRAPSGMRAGKILVALSGGCAGYRADIDAIHSTIAEVANS